jgi:Transposase DDE domain
MALAALPPPLERRPQCHLRLVPPPASLNEPPAPAHDEIERLLRALLEEVDLDTPTTPPRGRPRILPASYLWAALLVAVLHGDGSQREVWRRLSLYGVWEYPPLALSDQAVYHRLARDGVAPLQHLFTLVSQVLAARLAPLSSTDLAPFATGIYALDTSTLDALARRLPPLAALPPGDTGLLPGKLAGAFDVRRQQWARVEHINDASENDKVSARRLVLGLPRFSLILADLGYFGFAWFDDLSSAQYYWISRLRAKTSYTPLHTFYTAGETYDGIVWLGAHRADQARHAVRLVQFRQGGVLRQYLTNVRDPETLPLAAVAALYARRWDFELAAKLVKQHLGLRLFWSSQAVVVEQQLWGVLVLSQVLQALRWEIAGQAGVDVFDVSLALLVRHLPRLLAAGRDPVATLVAEGRRLGFIRPARRIQIRAPDIDPALLCPRPVGLALTRTPRYAQRRCND